MQLQPSDFDQAVRYIEQALKLIARESFSMTIRKCAICSTESSGNYRQAILCGRGWRRRGGGLAQANCWEGANGAARRAAQGPLRCCGIGAAGPCAI
jgi:hypothetical protein